MFSTCVVKDMYITWVHAINLPTIITARRTDILPLDKKSIVVMFPSLDPRTHRTYQLQRSVNMVYIPDFFLLMFSRRDLSNNQIQKIATDAFRNLKSLTSL